MIIETKRRLINLNNYCDVRIYDRNGKTEIVADRAGYNYCDIIATFETEEHALKTLEALSIAWGDKKVDTFYLDDHIKRLNG